MQRFAVLIGGAALCLGVLFSLFDAIISNPTAFAVTFFLGGLLIGTLFYRGEGIFGREHPDYPPYSFILSVLAVCLIVSWVIGSRPTSISDCPTSVSRWC